MPNDPADPSPIGPSTSVSASADVPLSLAWEGFVPIELPVVFPDRKGPIPPVVAVEGQTGRWDEVGRSRTVVIGDGSRVQETVTLSEPSGGAPPTAGRARFAYTVSGFSGPLGRLAKEARGLWVFTERDGRTIMEWTYAFVATGPLARPVLALVVVTFWRAYMRAGMANVVRELEKSRAWPM
ncbi:SRPBCC family protein [Jannaschia formosa]|uniref:SRPBCC family protein n=1 Tax=Jannaschia formosa TaxID=2259592 RepID=UPI000E1BE947|nr:SRPBCC family protein [Jannaschia formosa]TFL16998.1 SRPBCC family protein [Jannaschia formosa]